MFDQFLPAPRLMEFDYVYVGVPPEAAYAALRHFDGSRSPLLRALFHAEPLGQPDDRDHSMASGFQILAEQPGVEFISGAIGRFWESPPSFADTDPATFAAFAAPGWGKLTWTIQFQKWGHGGTRILFELRGDVTSEDVWERQQEYFRFIGPFSHLLRHHVLSLLGRELGVFSGDEQRAILPGDDFILLPKAQADHTITIVATPQQIWPWLVYLGCRRGGWYTPDLLDDLDNGDSTDEVESNDGVPELAAVAVGDVFPATAHSSYEFTVLQVEPLRGLVVGGNFDLDAASSVPVSAALPARGWRASWAVVLRTLDSTHTQVHVRARVDFETAAGACRALWMAPVHHFMQAEQLRQLKRCAEGYQHAGAGSARDVGAGIVAALGMVANLATPFLRRRRSHWGVSVEVAQRRYPGDELVLNPKWAWTHGVEIDAPADAVWPWVVQIGQDKAGFYSYQWLENLAGCNIHNAQHIHPEWQQLQPGDPFRIYGGPAQALTVVKLEPGYWFVVHGEIDPTTGGPPTAAAPARFVQVSWLFFVEPLAPQRSRFISRYRIDYGQDRSTRLTFGPLLVEPVGFVMDRRMLLGVKERAEQAYAATAASGKNDVAEPAETHQFDAHP